MTKYFQFHSNLDAFQLFSKEHLVTIAIILFLSTLLLFSCRNKLQKKGIRTISRLSLAFLLVATDVSQHIWLITERAWSIRRDLPLQLSDLVSILAVVMLFAKSEKLFQFMYFAGLTSSIQAIMTPDLGNFSFPHFQYIEFFISHGGTVLSILFMLAINRFTPTHRSLWITVLILNIYALGVYFLNKTLASNYLYIMKKPESSTLLDYFGPWPWYLLSIELVMIFSFFILYWIIFKKVKIPVKKSKI